MRIFLRGIYALVSITLLLNFVNLSGNDNLHYIDIEFIILYTPFVLVYVVYILFHLKRIRKLKKSVKFMSFIIILLTTLPTYLSIMFIKDIYDAYYITVFNHVLDINSLIYSFGLILLLYLAYLESLRN